MQLQMSTDTHRYSGPVLYWQEFLSVFISVYPWSNLFFLDF
jgi:hypothetical protein